MRSHLLIPLSFYFGVLKYSIMAVASTTSDKSSNHLLTRMERWTDLKSLCFKCDFDKNLNLCNWILLHNLKRYDQELEVTATFLWPQ